MISILLLLLYLFNLCSLTEGQGQVPVSPGITYSAQGNELDPDGDLWWVDAYNKYSFQSLKNLLEIHCQQHNSSEAKFRYFNNAGQVYVRMTHEWIFMEFWYPYIVWSGYATTAQIINGAPNQCYQCIQAAGYPNPELYDFMERRANAPDNNCWDECIGDNTFLNTGDTDQDPVFSWAFFETEIFRDLSLPGQPPEEYRLPPSNIVDLVIPHAFNRSLEIVRVSNAFVYSYITGNVFYTGAQEIPYVHGCWFRRYVNSDGNEWVSPFKYPPGIFNPFSRNLYNETCFTWITSREGITGKFGTLNEQYWVDRAGIACPSMSCVFPTTTTLAPTARPTTAPVRPTSQPTIKPIPNITFTGLPCLTQSMDLFVIVDASKSITDESFNREKVWVKQLFMRIQNEFIRINTALFNLGFPDRICFRAGVITFSHLIAMPMNFSMWDCNRGGPGSVDVGYNINQGNNLINNIGRPHPANTRFAGTHIRDALDGALLMYNTSNKTCTNFYGIALTDGLPQSYRTGVDTNQNPCLAGYRGERFQDKLTNFYWVPVERDPPFNVDLFTCLLSPPTQNIITQDTTIPMASFNTPQCQMCRTNPPTRSPTRRPTFPPTRRPTLPPTRRPTLPPTRRPTLPPTRRPTLPPTRRPTLPPTRRPTLPPTRRPTLPPTRRPTLPPTRRPTLPPTRRPTLPPTRRPTLPPTRRPTVRPTLPPTRRPTRRPTLPPTVRPTRRPTFPPTVRPTRRPTFPPTIRPTRRPTFPPTIRPTRRPTFPPTIRPTRRPTFPPTLRPTRRPTFPPTLRPTRRPTFPPTLRPTRRPTFPPTIRPTRRPTFPPTIRPTRRPTFPPTLRPTRRPTFPPTIRPTRRPTFPPTLKPTRRPTFPPTIRPTRRPTFPPTLRPTRRPTFPPTIRPTRRPTFPPTRRPTRRPTFPPTLRPTRRPTFPPTLRPTRRPTFPPTIRPTRRPTFPPTGRPTRRPTLPPTLRPTRRPTFPPTGRPTRRPTLPPTLRPTRRPTFPPTIRPTRRPSFPPTLRPTRRPTFPPTGRPTRRPTLPPTLRPTRRPTFPPTLRPTRRPTFPPTIRPTRRPTFPPTGRPTRRPTFPPTLRPSRRPTLPPTGRPTRRPTLPPTLRPTRRPTFPPTLRPTRRPTFPPTGRPTRRPTLPPTLRPTRRPTFPPTLRPTRRPTLPPTLRPTRRPTFPPTLRPTRRPTFPPTLRPTRRPTFPPTLRPTRRPTFPPTQRPTPRPTRRPTRTPTLPPTLRPTRRPTFPPTLRPTRRPTFPPTLRPTRRPTFPPTLRPTRRPTFPPTLRPTRRPTFPPTLRPTRRPTFPPTLRPTRRPTFPPTLRPTRRPTFPPTLRPTRRPTFPPTLRPTRRPTFPPTLRPTRRPTFPPTLRPTRRPTFPPTLRPTRRPTFPPTLRPTRRPTFPPTLRPTRRPTFPPTLRPTRRPTFPPTLRPTRRPTFPPTLRPTRRPTFPPTLRPTRRPTVPPTLRPTRRPTTPPTLRPTRRPTQVPTTLPPTTYPTMAPTVCIPPPRCDIPTCSCPPMSAEWTLELIDFVFDKHKDRTFVQYQVCVYAQMPSPFNPLCYPNGGMPVPLDKLFIQVPCNCDICIDFVTKDMDPDGYTTELDRGWVWESGVKPGECQFFELAVKGHSTLKTGFYQLFGTDDRCTNDTILVPDICEEMPHHHPQHWAWDTTTLAPGQTCPPREPLFTKDMCWDACDAVEHTEWSIQYLYSNYNSTTQMTSFVYRVNTSPILPNPSCNMFDQNPAPLTDLTIRLGCDCEPQSDTYLRSITDHMIPSGIVEDNFWRFDNLDVRAGESKIITIVLKGDIQTKPNGDVTLGGNHRCVSTSMGGNAVIPVPNPCSNRCIFGQWTDWQLQGSCSLECGGGEQMRTRTCVSVCDGSTIVDNCPGEAHGTVPCNTHPCPVHGRDSSSSSDSSDRNWKGADSSSSSSSGSDSSDRTWHH